MKSSLTWHTSDRYVLVEQKLVHRSDLEAPAPDVNPAASAPRNPLPSPTPSLRTKREQVHEQSEGKRNPAPPSTAREPREPPGEGSLLPAGKGSQVPENRERTVGGAKLAASKPARKPKPEPEPPGAKSRGVRKVVGRGGGRSVRGGQEEASAASAVAVGRGGGGGAGKVGGRKGGGGRPLVHGKEDSSEGSEEGVGGTQEFRAGPGKQSKLTSGKGTAEVGERQQLKTLPSGRGSKLPSGEGTEAVGGRQLPSGEGSKLPSGEGWRALHLDKYLVVVEKASGLLSVLSLSRLLSRSHTHTRSLALFLSHTHSALRTLNLDEYLVVVTKASGLLSVLLVFLSSLLPSLLQGYLAHKKQPPPLGPP